MVEYDETFERNFFNNHTITTNGYPRNASVTQFDGKNFSLRGLRQDKKNADTIIQVRTNLIQQKINTHINFIKLQKKNWMRKKLLNQQKDLVREHSQYQIQERKQRLEEFKRQLMQEKQKKLQSNRSMRSNIHNNRTIAIQNIKQKANVYGHHVRSTKKQHESLLNTIKQRALNENSIKVNKIKQDLSQVQEKKRIKILGKTRPLTLLRQRESKLKMKMLQQREQKIQELQKKQVYLLHKLELSEKFKNKCEIQLAKTRQKYVEFYGGSGSPSKIF